MDSIVSPRVFVANVAGHDYTKLKRYGEIAAITTGHISFGSLDRVRYVVIQGMLDATAIDYLAVSGAAIVNVIAALAWYERFGVVQLLNYDKKTDAYRMLMMTKESTADQLEIR